MQEKKILIIGGSGAFGQFYSKIFKQEGFEVTITSKDPENTKKAAENLSVFYTNNPKYSDYDYIGVCVPNDQAIGVIKKVVPKMKKNAIIFDFGSVKEKVCDQLNKYKKKNIQIVSIHPMHGPRVENIKHQPIAWIEICPGEKTDLLKRLFENNGALIVPTSAKKHDTTLSIVQGLTHYTMFVSSSVIKKSKQDIESTLLLASPNYKLFLMNMSRIILQNPSLYSEIQLSNPYNEKIRKIFTKEAKSLEKICSKRNGKELTKILVENGKYFKKGNLLLEESDKAISATN